MVGTGTKKIEKKVAESFQGDSNARRAWLSTTGACTIKLYGFLYFGWGGNLRSAVPSTNFSVNNNDNYSLIQGKIVTEKIDP